MSKKDSENINTTSISHRIGVLVKHFCKGNNTLFSRLIGTSEANIRNYINGIQPKFDVLNLIAIKFEINCEWLLTGKGEMLKSDNITENTATTKETIVYQSDPRDKELLNSRQNVIDLQEYKIKSLEEENHKLKTEVLGFSKSASSVRSYGTYQSKSKQTKE